MSTDLKQVTLGGVQGLKTKHSLCVPIPLHLKMFIVKRIVKIIAYRFITNNNIEINT